MYKTIIYGGSFVPLRKINLIRNYEFEIRNYE